MNPVGGLLEKKIGPRRTVVLGGAVVVCGTLLTSVSIGSRKYGLLSLERLLSA